MNDEKITPLSEKIFDSPKNKFGFSNGKRVDVLDLKQALKNFFEEENEIIKDYVDGKICELTFWGLRREAKLKHFGEGLI